MTKNTKVLLLIVAVIALLRFLVVPVFNAQTALLEERRSYQEKIQRSKSVLNKREEIEFSLIKAESELQRLKKAFLSFNTSSDFRFQVQSGIEKAANRFNINIGRTNWQQSPVETSSEELISERLNLQLAGEGLQFLEFLRFLNQYSISFKIAAMRVDLSSEPYPMRRIEGSITIDIIYQVTGRSN